MLRSQFGEEQTIGILREQEAGMKVAEVCRKRRISDAMFQAWKAGCGGLEVSEARRLIAASRIDHKATHPPSGLSNWRPLTPTHLGDLAAPQTKRMQSAARFEKSLAGRWGGGHSREGHRRSRRLDNASLLRNR
jgi:hypothetical protein